MKSLTLFALWIGTAVYGQSPIRLQNVSYEPGQKLFVGLEETDLGAPLQILASDSTGRPVQGVEVVFEIVASPSKSKGAALKLPSARTGPDGIARNEFRLGSQAGDYIIIARSANMEGSTPEITVRAQRTMWWFFLVIGLFGGLGIFLFGMSLGSGGLQKAAGSRLRSILAALTSNRWMGLLVGILVTAIVQSSSATSVMVVGLVSSALMTLTQAIGVLMGAHIGTTITVQLIAFNVSDYSLLLVGAGFVMTLVTKRKIYIYIGEIILGFGFIFFGMAVMSQAIAPLKSMPAFIHWLIQFGEKPLLGILASTLFTAIIQSSGATIGLCVVMASEGLLSLESAMPLVLGANVGTCVTALLSTIGATTEGKRTAVAHTMFSIFGVVVFTPILVPFEKMVVSATHAMGTDTVMRQIANGHMLFNILSALLLIGFVPLFARLITALVKGKPESEEFRPKYLNNAYLETPEIALQQAHLEEERLSQIVRSMVSKALAIFAPHNEQLLAELKTSMTNADKLEFEIRRYLTRLSQKNISLQQSKRLMRLLMTLDDLRHIAERIGVGLSEMADKYSAQSIHFSKEGQSELESFFNLVQSRLNAALDALSKESVDMASRVIQEKTEIAEKEIRLRESHFKRLTAGGEDTVNSSTMHLDLLTSFKRLDSFGVKIAHEVIDQFKF